jgi:hypothetical protein
METIQKEFKNFNLEYDGVYIITLSENRKVQACLTLDTLLKMLWVEGLKAEDVVLRVKNFEAIEFKNVTLVCEVFDKGNGAFSFRTSEMAEEHNMNGLSLVDFQIKE